ncbi:DUF1972 domain-containing protein [Carboxylicivirga sp. N1Y90]|uniref:DUF1972 domain-containing protein n=1 Tax=Carboxylicivirga fragile TaxID=3417571 RepID=UPI003D348E34|nr:DUF1972 domain-containing protein [Marinilabiliaceae bacterium N1Y90]
MRIAIIGTRGIPNYYGGFEQFSEYLSKYLVTKGHDVSVYNSHYHPYQETEWEGVKIIHKYDPEQKIGTAGQFIYDLNCILDTRTRGYDIILQLGYTSSSIWGRLMPKGSKVVTNMDGLEWKRTKYSKKVQKFLLYAEKLGVVHSDHLVADSIGIQNYLKEKYSVESSYIAYGSHTVDSYNVNTLADYYVEPYKYNMLIARLEPENSMEMILDGVKEVSTTNFPFLVIGKHETKYGEYLKEKFKEYPGIKFLGGIYDITKLNNLRRYANVYFHGHTVGGTNPSLLEAMGSGALICANDNLFNRSILGDDAKYFNSTDDVKNCLSVNHKEERNQIIESNFNKIRELYNWERIVSQYEEVFIEMLRKKEL